MFNKRTFYSYNFRTKYLSTVKEGLQVYCDKVIRVVASIVIPKYSKYLLENFIGFLLLSQEGIRLSKHLTFIHFISISYEQLKPLLNETIHNAFYLKYCKERYKYIVCKFNCHTITITTEFENTFIDNNRILCFYIDSR